MYSLISSVLLKSNSNIFVIFSKNLKRLWLDNKSPISLVECVYENLNMLVCYNKVDVKKNVGSFISILLNFTFDVLTTHICKFDHLRSYILLFI